jgi:uncharacterized protein (TIGR01777 family)
LASFFLWNEMDKIIVTGATGFIGKALCFRLEREGYKVIALSRNPERGQRLFGSQATVARWDGANASEWMGYAEGAHAIVNLAGENIGSGRWTSQRKQAILQSRLDAGKAVVQAVESANVKPRVVIQASAIGFYGTRGNDMIDEFSSPGKGFLANVAKEWEQSTHEVESFGVRRVIIRSGVVLGAKGGALLQLLKPFRFFAGGPLGSGRQWFSWIHIDDEVNAILFLLKREDLTGVFNLSAPHPLLQKEFARMLGKIIRRPSWFPTPGFMLRTILGEMAEEMLLVSQRVSPKRLLEAGNRFLYPEAEHALQDILGKNPK